MVRYRTQDRAAFPLQFRQSQQRFGLSHAGRGGTAQSKSAPELEVEGEMHADLALSEGIRNGRFPGSRLQGKANLLVMPNQDAANIAFNMLKLLADGISIGPILVGTAKPAQVSGRRRTSCR